MAKIYELGPPDELNPLAIDDPALDVDATPIEVELISLTFLSYYLSLECIGRPTSCFENGRNDSQQSVKWKII